MINERLLKIFFDFDGKELLNKLFFLEKKTNVCYDVHVDCPIAKW